MPRAASAAAAVRRPGPSGPAAGGGVWRRPVARLRRTAAVRRPGERALMGVSGAAVGAAARSGSRLLAAAERARSDRRSQRPVRPVCGTGFRARRSERRCLTRSRRISSNAVCLIDNRGS
ncbi:hypothetical protein GCM10023224_00260 [Streptomonospora halophila]|uniref:Uncharacterized protein n=1 Tax=Streptomonospora halophila TaxID=427369 RepID=A0ABP9G2G0_9ACTN